MHFKTHFGDLLTAEQEKILLETSELFNENIMNMRLVLARKLNLFNLHTWLLFLSFSH